MDDPRYETLRADYERFERSTRKELADRDAALIEYQMEIARLREEIARLKKGVAIPV